MSISGIADAQTPGLPASPAIYLNQSGFYPKAPKIAVIASNKLQKFSILSINKRVVFTGQTKAAAHPDLSGDSTCIADFTTLQQPGKYMLQITGGERSYPFTISAKIHREVAAAAIKGFYYQRASVALPPTYAGKWNRTAGHPDNIVIIHPSAATDVRPAGTIISSPRGWYDAGDYNKYIVNSGISMGTLLSLYEDFPAYNRSAHLNIPESGDKVPDLLNEIVWNLRWMLTMQDPADGGVYHKLTNAVFDWMIMPDKAVAPRYVVQKGTAATLDFAAVMAQASRIFNNYNRQLPGLADSCMSAAANAWHWAIANPGVAYDQNLMNTKFKPAVVTGDYGDNYFADEFTWAAAELYITTRNDDYLKHIPLANIKLTLPTWSNVNALGHYSLARNSNKLTPAAAKFIPEVNRAIIDFADGLLNNLKLSAYQTVMGTSAQDFSWGSNAVAANQGIALIQAYLLTRQVKYADAALGNLDYLLGRNGTGYCFITGFGSKSIMHPHHRPSIADGITDPVPGLLSGGPNPGRQDSIAVPSSLPNLAFVDDERAYAVNEIAINWNAPLAYLANAIEALQYDCGYIKK